MRSHLEPTARNLLRKPLVLGVPFFGMVPLAFLVLGLSLLLGSSWWGNALTIATAFLGYVGLRIFCRFAKPGWEEAVLDRFERLSKRSALPEMPNQLRAPVEVVSPDTLEASDLVAIKQTISDRIKQLKAGESWKLWATQSPEGLELYEGQPTAPKSAAPFVYSLYRVPVYTDPYWLFVLLTRIKADFQVFVRIDGLDYFEVKKRVESSRRRNVRGEDRLFDVDSEVTFQEASQILDGLSRGDETLVEMSVVITSKVKLDLDPAYFHLERDPQLALRSVAGERKRFHRSHIVRAVTASDFIPNVGDPKEEGSAILRTLRGMPLYFSPMDARLEALHWLVVGASGSGKSFLTGLVLKRMIRSGVPMSVLFIDHNRSFRRLVRNEGGEYQELDDLRTLQNDKTRFLSQLNQPGSMIGIELSDLGFDEKKLATHFLLTHTEAFLRSRDTTHPVYVVMDECWNFMRDEPVLVQRFFREFRKLNGAAVAITQSLTDFLSDECGQSIFQNAPIRILLRQGEDPAQYKGILGLNEVELKALRFLRQRKGEFSECLIKTPFLSRIGRLYPTQDEHALLRTDNLRAELIAEARALARNAIQERRNECVNS